MDLGGRGTQEALQGKGKGNENGWSGRDTVIMFEALRKNMYIFIYTYEETMSDISNAEKKKVQSKNHI